uniref:Uncharacterized protein n=1 Tax=Arundo donax TaxID=35708 RepID=A0A0A9A6J4_ARUDO
MLCKGAPLSILFLCTFDLNPSIVPRLFLMR